MKNTILLMGVGISFLILTGCLALSMCYAEGHTESITIAHDVLETGMNPNLIIKNFTKILEDCPHEQNSALATPGNSSTALNEKAEIARIGCSRKFLEKSGYIYEDIKTDVQKKCQEENTFVEEAFEFQTVYEQQRRYIFACTAEIQCYEIKKGARTSSPVMFRFVSKIPIKGPLKP